MNSSTLASARPSIQPTKESLLVADLIAIDDIVGLHQEISRLYGIYSNWHRGQTQIRQSLAILFLPETAIPALASRAGSASATAAVLYMARFVNMSVVAEGLLAYFNADKLAELAELDRDAVREELEQYPNLTGGPADDEPFPRVHFFGHSNPAAAYA